MYYAPSGILSQRYLSRTLEIVGADRLMFSQDSQYQSSVNGGARTFVVESGPSLTDKEAFAHGTWDTRHQLLTARS